jgi:uncharacterized protein YkwD
MAAMLALTLALAACASARSTMTPPPPDRVNVTSLPQGASAAAQSGDPISQAVLSAVNQYRAGHDAPALVNDASLEHVAAVHSADMSMRNFVGHYNPDGQGPKERLLAVMPDYKGDFAENIAVVKGLGSKTPDAVAQDLVKKWAGSLDHRKNLRNAAFTRSGVGIAHEGDTIYATELFAGP